MIENQESISIPLAYIEAFVMMLGAFLIGYIGATLYERSRSKKQKIEDEERFLSLENKIKELRDENDRQINQVYQKDRMDQEYEQVQFQKRAFSERVLTETVEKSRVLDFERIGQATAEIKDDLQQITGIGPYTEAKLNDLGIYTFEQIGQFNDDDILLVTELIKFFPDRIKNDRWVAKAQSLKFKDSQNQENDTDSKKKVSNTK